MKTNKLLMLVVLLSSTLFSAMCSSDDDSDSNNNQNEINQIENNVESGDWVITYFYDTDQEETSDYNGYIFDFASNGVLTASNGTNTYAGTWSVTDSNSNDDSSSDDDLDFNIFFSSPEDFAELSDDWDIISTSSTQIQLIDISGGNGGTDYLTFTKQ